MMHDSPNQTRLIAKVIREVLGSQRFDSLPDLTEAVKTRCAKLRVSATPDTISSAYRLIESNTALVKKQPAKVLQMPAPPRELSDAEARQIYIALMTRYRAEHPVPAPAIYIDRPSDFPDLVRV